MNKIPITLKGAEKMREEIKFLKYTKRPEIIESLATARAHGDLKENAEYHAAREQQSFNEGRIQQLESALSNAQVIDPLTVDANGKVVFGATVELYDIEADTEVTYQIVGDIEANISKNLISVNSPIARAIIGKKVDDEIEFKAPSGIKEYEIVGVRYE